MEIRGKKVIIFEDNQLNALVVAEHLERRGALVSSYSDPSAALGTDDFNDTALIISDYMMGPMDGGDLMDWLENTRCGIPLIFFTASLGAMHLPVIRGRLVVLKPDIKGLLSTIESI